MKERKIINKAGAPDIFNPNTNLILKNIDEVIYYVNISKDGEKEITFLTDKIQDILGISKQKYLALGNKIIKHCHPEDVPVIYEGISNLLKHKKKGSIRYRFFNKLKKRYIWLEETIYPQLDKKKKLVGYFGVSRNIDHEKANEEKISDSEKKFRLLAENSSDIIFQYQFKPKALYTYVSPSVEHILGYKPEKFYKDPLIGFKIIHPEDRAQLLSSQQNILKGKTIKKTFEALVARYKAKDGRTVWLENRYSPIFTGKEITALHCVSRDITAQKLQEQESESTKNRHSNILSNLPGMAYRCLNDKQWTMKFISSGALSLTGYKPEEFIDNKKRSFASIIHPDDRQLGKAEITRALKERRSFEIEYRIIEKGGRVKWIWEKGLGIYAGSRLVYIEGFINDISARKEAEHELNQKRLNYQNVLNLMPVGVFVHVNGKIRFGNAAAYEIAEITPKDDIEKITLLDFLRPEDKATGIERIKRAMNGEDTPFIEYHITGLRGTQRVIRTKSSPIIYNATQAVQIIVQDITNEKKLEEERIKARIAERTNIELQNEINLRVESEQKLKAIFNSSAYMIWTVDDKLQITSYNDNYRDSVKALCGVDLQKGVNIKEFSSHFVAPHYSELATCYKSAFSGVNQHIEVSFRAINKEIYYREIFLHPIIIDGKIREVAAIAQDTTKRKNFEKQIIEQSARLRAIFKSGSQLMWTVDNKHRLTSFNKNYADAIYEMYGVYPELNTEVNRLPEKMRSIEYNSSWNGKYAEVLRGKSLEFDTERTTLAGKKVYRHIFLHPIYDDENSVIEVSAIGYDISAQKRAQEEIISKQSQLSAIINTTDDIIFSIDKEFRLLEFNDVLAQIIRKRTGREAKTGKVIFEFLPPEQVPSLRKTYQEALEGSGTVVTEVFIVDGDERFYEAHYNPIKIGGSITGVAVFSRDITEKKRSEESTLKSLKEKEVLLKEVHHRVKNNLQVISSILNLQTAYLRDKGTINLLKECQNRIKTMAFIHESLYQNKDFSQINFSEYIITLVKNLFYSFETNQQKIKANFDVDPILLNLDTSIPCGLIVNELVSNALKYAFDDGREGAIFITLKKQAEKIKIVVADNGRGLPDKLDFRNTETLGLQLVSTLTEQINGTISLNKNKGTTFEIIF